MKRLFYLFLFLTNLSFSQTTFVVKDSETTEVLPKATIDFLNGNVTHSDENGKVVIPKEVQEIEISHLGYISQRLKVSEIKEVVLLKQDFFEVEKITISSKPTKGKKSIGKGYHGSFESECAVLIPSTEKNIDKRIVALKYRLVDSRYTMKNNRYLPFRACIYSVDSITQKPDKKIFRSDVVSMKKKQKWFSVNIDSKNIKMPKEGLFIVLEATDGSQYNYLRINIGSGAADAIPVVAVKLFYNSKSPNISYYRGNLEKREDSWKLIEGHFLMDFEFEK